MSPKLFSDFAIFEEYLRRAPRVPRFALYPYPPPPSLASWARPSPPKFSKSQPGRPEMMMNSPTKNCIKKVVKKNNSLTLLLSRRTNLGSSKHQRKHQPTPGMVMKTRSPATGHHSAHYGVRWNQCRMAGRAERATERGLPARGCCWTDHSASLWRGGREGSATAPRVTFGLSLRVGRAGTPAR